MEAIEAGNSVFTNVGLTDDGDVWWEGLTDEPPAHLTDWRGNDWTPADADDRPAAHPNSRFCTPIGQVPILAPEYDSPRGVPISAIFFGGRRRSTIPLVTQSRDWTHGVFMGATLSSETTAAAAGQVGVVRRDPMAMLPFLGYDAGDYLSHWLSLVDDPSHQLPAVFYVNWFRRDDDGSIIWPGFSENSRVLKWAIERVEGKADAVETPTGYIPTPESIDTAGLDLPDEELAAALAVDPQEWQAEIPDIEEWFERLGPTVPQAMHEQLDRLRASLNT
ncbi:MAG TPA: phosphoenolpyruvate carboxykinase domain-containing protein [Jiangellaceae bacterium]|nr:phosphoenolpyruvate carboxykinase domain-containing protein [Jiangellaceae bacterium]